MDDDNEVRDRATFYLNVLEQKQKALNAGYILNGEPSLPATALAHLELWPSRAGRRLRDSLATAGPHCHLGRPGREGGSSPGS